jgi:hypothetical protein
MNWEKQHEATGGSLVLDWESLTARFNSFGNRTAKHGGSGGLAGPHSHVPSPERSHAPSSH